MGRETTVEYHRRRAAGELDLAYEATAFKAMEAHFRLSALHLARLRELTRHPVQAVRSHAPAAAYETLQR